MRLLELPSGLTVQQTVVTGSDVTKRTKASNRLLLAHVKPGEKYEDFDEIV